MWHLAAQDGFLIAFGTRLFICAHIRNWDRPRGRLEAALEWPQVGLFITGKDKELDFYLPLIIKCLPSPSLA